jgi:hypothetical protein
MRRATPLHGAKRTPRRLARAGLAAALAALLVVAIAASAAAEEVGPAEPIPVLGSKRFSAPFGAGFGTAEPEVIFNGGDPSGEVSKIHWRGWGEPSAIGTGLEPIFKPRGGYFRKPGRVELRATALGKCGPKAAYTRLEFRAPKHPGGKLGRWMLWSGEKTICVRPH